MTQPPEELRWRIEQMEEERGYLERWAAINPDRAMQKLYGELHHKIELWISNLYASTNPQSKTAKIFPKR